MGSKGHFWTSLLKSVIRIGACAVLIVSEDLIVFATILAFAEICGIAEEILDER